MRNVLLMIADDWSPIAGCYGNPIIRTPNVDRLAAESVRFNRAFCASPSCAASRATVLTGLHSHAHGQYGHCHQHHTFRLRPNTPTLPAVLESHGISTGIVGKRHVFPPDLFPWSFALDESVHDQDSIVVGAEKFLSQVDEKPFCLYVGFIEPHRGLGGFNNSRIEYSPAEVIVPDFLPDLPEVREELADYYTAVTRLDSGFGKVLDALERSGHGDDTLVIVMSDHGMPFPGAKASSFDSGHQCPLLVRHPERRERGAINNALVNWTDIMPTILDWFGVKGPPMHGRSFLPVLDRSDPTDWNETTYSHTFHEVNNYYPYRVIRQSRFKYLLNLFPELTLPLPTDLFGSRTWQAVERRGLSKLGQRSTAAVLHQPREALYDMHSDPAETINLIDRAEHRPLVTKLRSRMQHFRESTGDLWLVSDEQRHLRTKEWK